MREKLPYSVWAPGRLSKKRGYWSAVWREELGIGSCRKEPGVGLKPLEGVMVQRRGPNWYLWTLHYVSGAMLDPQKTEMGRQVNEYMSRPFGDILPDETLENYIR